MGLGSKGAGGGAHELREVDKSEGALGEVWFMLGDGRPWEGLKWRTSIFPRSQGEAGKAREQESHPDE